VNDRAEQVLEEGFRCYEAAVSGAEELNDPRLEGEGF